VSIPALQAIVGNLNVNYQPTNAEVWIDGRKAGTSPDVFRNITVGSHNVELRAAGYASKQERVTVVEGKTAMLSGALERQQSTAVASSSSPSSASSSGVAVETITVNGVSFNMVRVDGGTFTMGATSEQGSDAWDSEKPAHQVTLSTYSIGETEVTQALWQAVMGSNPSNWQGDNLPVEQVSWEDCQTFIQKLNQLTGRRFRLPTEAEWEYAARGGNKSRGYKYSGSNSIGDVAWYDSNSSYKTHPVKTKQANELGLYDMNGNVYEWCQDRYGSYRRRSQTNPDGPSSGSSRVDRGGSWFNVARDCRVSSRNYSSPGNAVSNLGLRLALQ
jgi:formylglycine-generating enzyme required for sulfatase activity